MPHSSVQKLLFNLVRFLKKTSFHHKKKLIVLVVIALLSYIAKKKLHFIHLLQLAQTITKVISYLPLPTIPIYRKLNNFQPVFLHPLAKQILGTMNVQEIRQQIKQKTATWDNLKSSIISGTILSLMLFNVQSFYFIVQNKYSADFMALGSLEAFEQVMGQIRKSWVREIPVVKQIVEDLLFTEIKEIDVKEQYTLDQYVDLLEGMVDKVFGKKYVQVNQANEHVNRSINKRQLSYLKAKNYFTTPYEYIPSNSSKLSTAISTITSLIFKPFSLLSHLIPSPQCSLTSQRFEWSRIAYQIPLKKSVSLQNIPFPNSQSQHLVKMVLAEMGQVLGSVNFSTLLHEYAKFNLNVMKNRLFLYFSKSGKERLRCAEGLSVLYKLVKEEVLIESAYEKSPQMKVEFQFEQQNKRNRFYQGEILKAIKLKQSIQTSQLQPNAQKLLLQPREKFLLQPSQKLLLRQQLKPTNYQKPSTIQPQTSDNPQLYLTNLHLQQIYHSKQLSHLTSQFYVKYFNQRSGVVISPRTSDQVTRQRPGSEEDQMKKLLNMLGGNEMLNEKEN